MDLGIKQSSRLAGSHIINPVIVDCTSNDAVAARYVDFLGAGFHVVTANKKANTSSMDYYKQLRLSALMKRRKFLYDTNVGAGLPVIENMQNLFNAGDQLIKFNGILSGSLSFIFEYQYRLSHRLSLLARAEGIWRIQYDNFNFVDHSFRPTFSIGILIVNFEPSL